MMDFFHTCFSTGKRLLIITVLIAAITGSLFLGLHIHRRIIESRTVTQEKIAEGWKAAGIELTEHTIARKENYWKVAKEYHVDIDTIVGANPGLGKLSAALGQRIKVPNRKGVLHRTEDGETLRAVSELYRAPAVNIALVNNLGPDHILTPGLELFIPGAKPMKLSEAMTAHYSLRGIFGSPLPGRITSGMGMRTHPVGGFRGKHTGVDLRAQEGTRIAAAAAGTVSQVGEGEYIGMFVILSHKDGYSTIYGHCSEILTRPGKTVKKGEVIAKSGHTGRTTGPHLHFEIRKNGAPQDPLKYLW